MGVDKGFFSFSKEIGICPACTQPLLARLSGRVELDGAAALHPDGDGPGRVDAEAIITGMQVHHDCIPTTARAAAAPTTGVST